MGRNSVTRTSSTGNKNISTQKCSIETRQSLAPGKYKSVYLKSDYAKKIADGFGAHEIFTAPFDNNRDGNFLYDMKEGEVYVYPQVVSNNKIRLVVADGEYGDSSNGLEYEITESGDLVIRELSNSKDDVTSWYGVDYQATKTFEALEGAAEKKVLFNSGDDIGKDSIEKFKRLYAFLRSFDDSSLARSKDYTDVATVKENFLNTAKQFLDNYFIDLRKKIENTPEGAERDMLSAKYAKLYAARLDSYELVGLNGTGDARTKNVTAAKDNFVRYNETNIGKINPDGDQDLDGLKEAVRKYNEHIGIINPIIDDSSFLTPEEMKTRYAERLADVAHEALGVDADTLLPMLDTYIMADGKLDEFTPEELKEFIAKVKTNNFNAGKGFTEIKDEKKLKEILDSSSALFGDRPDNARLFSKNHTDRSFELKRAVGDENGVKETVITFNKNGTITRSVNGAEAEILSQDVEISPKFLTDLTAVVGTAPDSVKTALAKHCEYDTATLVRANQDLIKLTKAIDEIEKVDLNTRDVRINGLEKRVTDMLRGVEGVNLATIKSLPSGTTSYDPASNKSQVKSVIDHLKAVRENLLASTLEKEIKTPRAFEVRTSVGEDRTKLDSALAKLFAGFDPSKLNLANIDHNQGMESLASTLSSNLELVTAPTPRAEETVTPTEVTPSPAAEPASPFDAPVEAVADPVVEPAVVEPAREEAVKSTVMDKHNEALSALLQQGMVSVAEKEFVENILLQKAQGINPSPTQMRGLRSLLVDKYKFIDSRDCDLKKYFTEVKDESINGILTSNNTAALAEIASKYNVGNISLEDFHLYVRTKQQPAALRALTEKIQADLKAANLEVSEANVNEVKTRILLQAEGSTSAVKLHNPLDTIETGFYEKDSVDMSDANIAKFMAALNSGNFAADTEDKFRQLIMAKELQSTEKMPNGKTFRENLKVTLDIQDPIKQAEELAKASQYLLRKYQNEPGFARLSTGMQGKIATSSGYFIAKESIARQLDRIVFEEVDGEFKLTETSRKAIESDANFRTLIKNTLGEKYSTADGLEASINEEKRLFDAQQLRTPPMFGRGVNNDYFFLSIPARSKFSNALSRGMDLEEARKKGVELSESDSQLVADLMPAMRGIFENDLRPTYSNLHSIVSQEEVAYSFAEMLRQISEITEAENKKKAEEPRQPVSDDSATVDIIQPGRSNYTVSARSELKPSLLRELSISGNFQNVA